MYRCLDAITRGGLKHKAVQAQIHQSGKYNALYLRLDSFVFETPEDGVLAPQRVAVISNSYKVCNPIVCMNIQRIVQTQQNLFTFFINYGNMFRL